MTFWQTPDDEKAFFKYLSNTGPILVYPYGRHRARGDLSPQGFSQYVARSRVLIALFALEANRGDIVINTFEREGVDEFSVSPMLSSVIAYEPGALSEQRLTATNVYAYWQTRREVRGAQTWVKKPETFVKWGKAVFRWLRRRAAHRTDGFALPMTAAVTKEIDKGLELVQY